MKRHTNRSRSKRLLAEAVLRKWYRKSMYFALAGSISVTATVWAKDDTSANQATLPEVVVSGRQEKPTDSYNTQDVSLSKYTEPLLDTPQSISVVPRQLMDDQNTSTLRDAVRNVAGISIAAGEAGAQGDALTLRGFSARNDIYLDGMRDFGSYYRDSFDYEKIEVLKGPSSIEFGRGSTGGVVNQVSKQAENYREISGEITYGSDNKKRVSVDINEPINKTTAVRVNAFKENSNVSDRDVAENNHSGAAIAAAFGMGTENRVTVDYLHEQQDDTPDYGIPWYLNAPAPVSRQNYYGFKGDNFLKTVADIVTIKGEHDFNDNVTLRDQVRYGHYTRDFRITEPQVSSLAGPVTRNQLAGDSTEAFLQNQLDLTTKFKTSFIDHTLVTGIETGRETSAPIRYTTWMGVPTTNLYNPNYDQSFSGSPTVITRTYTTGDTIALYGLDTMKLNEHWEIEAGTRWDQFSSRYKQTAATSSAFTQTDKMLSWRGALVYKPVEIGSIYFDYGTSFNPSAESLSSSAATSGLPPEENETYELGTKWDVFSKKMNIRGAIYETRKKNARETDPNNSTLQVLAGEQLVQGLELEAAGHLTDRWQIYSGYTFMKSRLDKSNFYPTLVGSELANVPQNMFNFWTTYDLPGALKKFQIGGGGNFVDERVASTTSVASNGLLKIAPGYWAFNSELTYHLNPHVDLQLNVYNLANKYYFDEIHPGHVVPGEGRTVTVSSKFKF